MFSIRFSCLFMFKNNCIFSSDFQFVFSVYSCLKIIAFFPVILQLLTYLLTCNISSQKSTEINSLIKCLMCVCMYDMTLEKWLGVF